MSEINETSWYCNIFADFFENLKGSNQNSMDCPTKSNYVPPGGMVSAGSIIFGRDASGPATNAHAPPPERAVDIPIVDKTNVIAAQEKHPPVAQKRSGLSSNAYASGSNQVRFYSKLAFSKQEVLNTD